MINAFGKFLNNASHAAQTSATIPLGTVPVPPSDSRPAARALEGDQVILSGAAQRALEGDSVSELSQRNMEDRPTTSACSATKTGRGVYEWLQNQVSVSGANPPSKPYPGRR